MGILAQKALRQMAKQADAGVLLDTPVRDLKEPLAVHSQILNEVIFLVANEKMARQVEDEEKIAYTPVEIAALSRASKDKDRDEWIDFLKKMHLVKKTFLGSKIQA
jgi:hypothetical protein